jgi:hypothetical protein
MDKFMVVEEQRWTLRGRVIRRRIVGAPCWEALQAWRDGKTIEAPSAQWLKEAIADALDEINRRP